MIAVDLLLLSYICTKMDCMLLTLAVGWRGGLRSHALGQVADLIFKGLTACVCLCVCGPGAGQEARNNHRKEKCSTRVFLPLTLH